MDLLNPRTATCNLVLTSKTLPSPHNKKTRKKLHTLPALFLKSIFCKQSPRCDLKIGLQTGCFLLDFGNVLSDSRRLLFLRSLPLSTGRGHKHLRSSFAIAFVQVWR